jgi:hypothetical protein
MVCQCLTVRRWFSTGVPVSSTNKTDRQGYNWNILKSGVKHHKLTKQFLPIVGQMYFNAFTSFRTTKHLRSFRYYCQIMFRCMCTNRPTMGSMYFFSRFMTSLMDHKIPVEINSFCSVSRLYSLRIEEAP